MLDILKNPKVKKILLITLILIVLICGCIFLLVLSSAESDPEKKKAKEEAYKAEWGYQTRIQELGDILHVDEYTASIILETLMASLDVDHVSSFVKAEKKQDFGNINMNIDEYQLKCMILGGEVYQVKIGKTVVYKKPKVASLTGETTDAMENLSLLNRVVKFKDYNTAVEKLAKVMKTSKDVAITNYGYLAGMSLNYLTDFKKFNNKADGSYGYSCKLGVTKLKLYTTGSLITKITIDTPIKEIIVWDGTTNVDEVNIVEYMPMLSARTGYAASMTRVIPWKMQLDKDTTVMFPAALDTGDDSWLMVYIDDYIYIEAEGDIRNGSKSKRKLFKIKLDGESKELIYLQVNKDVIIDNSK